VRTWLRRLLIVPPVAIGIAVLLWQLQSRTEPPQGEPEELTRTVRVIEAEPVDFVPRAVGYGTVAPGRVWEAVAQVGGKITGKHPDLERGRLIEEGTEVLRIDPTDYELAIARAQADLNSARAQLSELDVRAANTEASLEIERRALRLAEEDLERKRSLLERDSVSQATVDQAESALLGQRQRVQELENQLRLIPAERQVLEASIEVHEAQLEQARLDLERTRIRMPFDGRIAEVDVEPTQFVSVGQVLMVADSIDRAEIEAQFAIGRLAPLVRADIDLSALTAGELAQVPGRLGLEATVRLQADEVAASWDARFDRLSDRIDPQTRTVGVIVVVDEPYRKAIPGLRPPLAKDMFVEVELEGRFRENALVVPRVAVNKRSDGGAALYVADDQGRLEIRPVTLGPTQGDLVVVIEGLEPGERVVVSDLIPAIAGMKLATRVDAALAERLRAQAKGEPEDDDTEAMAR
jgi:multidrug efflux system membrane fusion protein